MVTKYKLISVDFDGTLLDTEAEDTILLEDIRALERAILEGIKVVVCTGRNLLSARKVLEKTESKLLGKIDLIVQNGAVVIRDEEDSPLFVRYLPSSVAKEIVSLIREVRGAPMVYSTLHSMDAIFVERGEFNPVLMAYIERRRRHTGIEESVIEVEDAMEVLDVDPVQVAIVDRTEKINRLYTLVENEGLDVAVIRTRSRLGGGAFWWLEFYDKGCSKEDALQRLAQLYGISKEEVVAIGDNLNDVGMLEWAGLGIAVGNAEQEVKEVARYVTKCCNECGVAFAVDKILAGEWQ